MWIDIVSIVFICVTANHLGLVKAIESVFNIEIPIVNCPKCASCWSVLIYLFVEHSDMVSSLAISFLASYSAIWLELFEGYVDTLYMKLYEKIYPDTDNDAPAADTDSSHSAGTVS